ncbi:hypothetical protein PTKIN_Ptkin10aG0000500 [Pterospermum kingtungense]
MFMRRWELEMEILEFAMDSLPVWVCIKIGVFVSIPKEIEVVLRSGKIVKVQVHIPRLPAKCLNCKIFGHGEKNCPKKAIEGKQWVTKKKGDNSFVDAFESSKIDNIENAKTSKFVCDETDRGESIKEVGTGNSKSFSTVAELMESIKIGVKESRNKEAKGSSNVTGAVKSSTMVLTNENTETEDKGKAVVVQEDERGLVGKGLLKASRLPLEE